MADKHDYCVACAEAILEVFENLLLESEKADAYVEVYARIMALLEVYERDRVRLPSPSAN